MKKITISLSALLMASSTVVMAGSFDRLEAVVKASDYSVYINECSDGYQHESRLAINWISDNPTASEDTQERYIRNRQREMNTGSTAASQIRSICASQGMADAMGYGSDVFPHVRKALLGY
jgi:hypothetical protein